MTMPPLADSRAEMNLTIGDSITNASWSYARLLGYDVLAASRTTSADWLPGGAFMPDELPGGHVVTILLGANDSHDRIPTATYAANMEAIALHVAPFYDRVLLLEPVKREGPLNLSRTRNHGLALRPICEEHGFECVDLWPVLRMPEDYSDGVHPRPTAHHVLAGVVGEAVPEPTGVLLLVALILVVTTMIWVVHRSARPGAPARSGATSRGE